MLAVSGTLRSAERNDMSTFGDDLIQSLQKALAHAKGDGPGIVHAPASPCGPDAGEPDASADTDKSSEHVEQ